MAVVSSVLAAEQSEITFDSSPATLVQSLQGARSTPSMVATISQTHSTRSAVISKTSSTHSRIAVVSSGLAAEQSLITFSSSPATLVQSMTGLLSAGKADGGNNDSEQNHKSTFHFETFSGNDKKHTKKK